MCVCVCVCVYVCTTSHKPDPLLQVELACEISVCGEKMGGKARIERVSSQRCWTDL